MDKEFDKNGERDLSSQADGTTRRELLIRLGKFSKVAAAVFVTPFLWGCPLDPTWIDYSDASWEDSYSDTSWSNAGWHHLYSDWSDAWGNWMESW